LPAICAFADPDSDSDSDPDPDPDPDQHRTAQVRIIFCIPRIFCSLAPLQSSDDDSLSRRYPQGSGAGVYTRLSRL